MGLPEGARERVLYELVARLFVQMQQEHTEQLAALREQFAERIRQLRMKCCSLDGRRVTWKEREAELLRQIDERDKQIDNQTLDIEYLKGKAEPIVCRGCGERRTRRVCSLCGLEQ